jgi:8-oxo-dGTP pyrophosphatase MutT (NUDIX family)
VPVATLRPAATVVVVRDIPATGGFDVLMVRRNDKVAFMAGAYVFPGGRVDDEDHAELSSTSAIVGETRFSDLTPDEERPYRIAAARELREEAEVDIQPRDLVPLAHWVTPEIEIRRFDTRFFLVHVPANQEARHDGGETTALAWLTPAAAIDRCDRGEIVLPPPTWTTLKRLTSFRTADALMAWAKTATIVRVQPMLIRDAAQTLLTLPGDPTYPTLDGWEIPQDTRFQLQDGQWRPVKP